MKSLLLVLLLGPLGIHLVAAGPQEFEELFERAMRLSDQGRDIEALEAFRAAARLSPDHPYVHFNIGRLLESHGLLSEAAVAYRRAVELAPGERPLQFALGESLYRAGRITEAVQPLELAVAPPDPLPEALLVLGAVYEREQKTEEALDTLARYVELRPEDVAARALLGDHLTGARRHEEALRVWKEGLSEAEPSAELLYRIGQNLSRDRDGYTEAEVYLRRALQTDPQHLESQLLLGRILTRQGKTEEGLELLSRASEEHPDSANVFYLLATLYQQLGREEEAREAGERFQRLSEESQQRDHHDAQIKVTYKRARELLDQGKMIEAEAAFKSVLELDPENVDARSVLAKIAFSRGRLQEAMRWIEEALQRDESNGEFHYLLALFQTRADDNAVAEPAARRAVELMPGFPDGWILLGSILSDSGRPAEAVDCYLRAAALEPSNATIQLNLASAYDALGKSAEESEAMARYRRLSSSEGAQP